MTRIREEEEVLGSTEWC